MARPRHQIRVSGELSAVAYNQLIGDADISVAGGHFVGNTFARSNEPPLHLLRTGIYYERTGYDVFDECWLRFLCSPALERIMGTAFASDQPSDDEPILRIVVNGGVFADNQIGAYTPGLRLDLNDAYSVGNAFGGPKEDAPDWVRRRLPPPSYREKNEG